MDHVRDSSKPQDLDVEIAGRLSNLISLTTIGFIESSVRYLTGPVKAKLRIKRGKIHVTWTRDSQGVFALFPLDIEIWQAAANADPPSEPLALIGVTVRVEYNIKEGVEVSNDDLRHYLGLTGLLHVWPYLRAEAHALTTKVALPPLILPIVVSGNASSVVEIGGPELQDEIGVSDAVTAELLRSKSTPPRPDREP